MHDHLTTDNQEGVVANLNNYSRNVPNLVDVL